MALAILLSVFIIRVRNTLNKAGGLPQAGDNRMVIPGGMFNFSEPTLSDLNRGLSGLHGFCRSIHHCPSGGSQ